MKGQKVRNSLLSLYCSIWQPGDNNTSEKSEEFNNTHLSLHCTQT